MDKYTIYCTTEQTKNALELGAPIATCGYYYKQQIGCNTISDTDLHIIPTAEQMIGWLRSRNIHIVIHKDAVYKWSVYGHEIEPIEFTVFDRLTSYNSFEEATLAAIDAALEYLTNSKK